MGCIKKQFIVTIKLLRIPSFWPFLFLIFLCFGVDPAIAQTGDLTTMANTIKTQAVAVATLLNVAAYVAGVGFAFGGILQFKAHKENPQQTPMSKPVVMIVVAACLLFLPSIMNIAGNSLFGQSGIQSIKYRPPMSGY